MPFSNPFESQQRSTRPERRAQKDRELKRLRQRMYNTLLSRGITSHAVLDAMQTVPRHYFVQEALQLQAYEDTSLPIGYGQTISQPSTVAFMTELLEVTPNMHILEIGTGSGYQAAILAQMGCNVVSIERLRELYGKTKALLRRLGFRSIHMHCGDGTLGFPPAAPYDRIIVTAGGPEIPEPLVQQLDDNGILLMPVGRTQRNQEIIRLRKVRGILYEETFGTTAFVNLVGSYGWGTR